MQIPALNRRPLDGESFDVVVIGGGINGVATARECAQGGKRTLLLEQHDFGSGTSSRSTRIIHGGLRYLEHGELGLVRQASRERQRLLRERPHLVHPVQFLLALNENSHCRALAVRFGLWLYRHVGGPRPGIEFAASEQSKLEGLLDSGRRWSIFNFEDAQCEFPERLIAEWLVEAIAAGAVARNHTEVLAVDVSHGRANGVRLRDRLSGKEEHVSATWIINATGPWADQICQRSQIGTPEPMVGGVRGSHIVVPKFAGAPEAAIYTEALDGRPIFVVPWNGQILVGTTEVPDHDDPGSAAPSAGEIEYLLRSFQRLFPSTKMTSGDIGYSFAGVRPLPFTRNPDPAAISRKHYLRNHADDGAANMISIIGGKLSTAAQLARECAAKIEMRRVRFETEAFLPGDGFDRLLERWTKQVAEVGHLGQNSARAMVEWYGKRSQAIAALAAGSTEMGARLCPHTEHIVAEAVDALQNECAVTLADVLLRRVPVALGACWSAACSREAAVRIAAASGWDDYRTATELENFEGERSMFLRKPELFESQVSEALVRRSE